MKLILQNQRGQSFRVKIQPNDTFRSLQKRVEMETGVSIDLDVIAVTRSHDLQKVTDYFLSKSNNWENSYYCAVIGCSNTKKNNPDKTYFEFPNDPIRCHQWILYCKRNAETTVRSRLQISAFSTVCSDHFTDDQFFKNSKTLLKRTAVPSVESTFPVDEAMKSDVEEENPSQCVCRLCAQYCEDFFLIFDELGKKLKIAEKIMLCLPIEVHTTDGLPKQICRECYDELNFLFVFADKSSLSQEKLQYIYMLETSPDPFEPIESYSNVNCSKENHNEIKGCPLCIEGQMKPVENGLMEFHSFDARDTYSNNDTNGNGSNGFILRKKVEDGISATADLMSNISSPVKKPVVLTDTSRSETTINGPSTSSDDKTEKHESGITRIVRKQLHRLMHSYFLGEECASAHILSDEPPLLYAFPVNCRICGEHIYFLKDVLMHCFSHSFSGFYQCIACIYFHSNKGNLINHIFTHEYKAISFHDCEFCQSSFTTSVALAAHQCVKKGYSTFECPNCGKIFTSQWKFSRHIKSCSLESPLMCNICFKIFGDKTQFKNHLLLHSSKNYFCNECGRAFKAESALRFHAKSHENTGLTLLPCVICGETFLKNSQLITHTLSSHQDSLDEASSYSCKLCHEAFPNTPSAVSHMDNIHSLESLDEEFYSFVMHTVKRVYICEFCDRVFATASILNYHREAHSSQSPFECKFCGVKFSSSHIYTLHVEKHIVKSPIPTEYVSEFCVPRTYLCEYCERSFLNKVKYTEHLTIHFGPEPYLCRCCPLKFINIFDAMKHRPTHTEAGLDDFISDLVRPLDCHYCCKTFAIEDALTKHLRMHTGEKPFNCNECGKSFTQSSGLYTHLKVHSSERPYTCSLCPRKFKIKGDRDVHERKHSGDRPYKCDICPKAFMTQQVYSQHRKIHTGERPYKCDECGVAFRRSHVLTVHKRIHSGEKPHSCDTCGKNYRQRGDMLKHRRIQHGLQSEKKLLQVDGQDFGVPCKLEVVISK